MGGNLRPPCFIVRGIVIAHGAPPALEGGPNCNRSIIPSSLAHRRASSTLTARCLNARPIESSWFEINFARAVAARSTERRYSLSPLVSPILGLTGLAGFCSDVIGRKKPFFGY